MYHVIKRREPYRELGPLYYEQRRRTVVVRQSIRKLEPLGYKVSLEEVAS